MLWEHEAMSRRVLLPILDGAALLLFVVIGLAQHDEGASAGLFLRNAIPLIGAWFAVAVPLGTYRIPGRRPGLRTLLPTWAVAVPAGLLLRTAWVGSPHGSEILVFLGIGLAFTLLFLTIGRAVARFVSDRGAPTTSGVVR
jgi:hypothetical protein